MSDFKVGKPGPGKPRFVKDEHEGHLLAVIDVKYEPDVSTAFGETDAAHVDTLVCIDCPAVWTDLLLFGQFIVERLCSSIDAVGIQALRIVKGQGKPGRNPPWLPEDPTDDDEKRVQEFLDAHASRLKSGRIVVEVPEPEDEAF